MNKYERIMALSRASENLYELLAEFEVNCLDDHEDYYKTIKQLEAFRKETEDILATLSNTEIINFQNTVAVDYGFDQDLDLIDEVAMKKTEILAERRLSMLLYYYGTKNHVYDYQVEEGDILTELEKNALNAELEKYNYCFDTEYIRESLLAYTLLDYLKIAIEQEKDEYVRLSLIRSKYNFISLLSCVEESFLKNPKDFSERQKYTELFLDRDFYEEDVQEHDDYISSIILNEVGDLEKLPEEYYNEKDNCISAYLKSIYIQAVYSLNISENIENIIDNVRNVMKEKNNYSAEYISNGLRKDLAYRISKKVD